MFYETTQNVGPGWHRSYKPAHYEDMSWSPSSKHFRSPEGSPQSYRRINRPEDCDLNTEEERFFSDRRSPTFTRKIFRDVWTDPGSSNHRFADRPRLFKRVFKPSNWDEDDDFERTRSAVRQMARDFDPDFDSSRMKRDFDTDFHHRERDLKSNIEEEFEKAAGRVHHIPIMVERRMDEMRSRFDHHSPTRDSNYRHEDDEDWQGPQVQRLKKNFETDNDFATLGRHRGFRGDSNKARSYTSPIPSKWDPDSVHTLPTRRSSKGHKMYDDTQQASPKSVFRSYSETHEDIPKQQQQHASAFRSHSDGHCPKTSYVTKISVNLPTSTEDKYHCPNGDVNEEVERNDLPENFDDSSDNCWDSHKSRQRTRCSKSETACPPNNSQTSQTDCSEQLNDPEHEVQNKKSEEKVPKENKRISLQQIAAVLQNVDDLLVHVEGYSGTGRDKQFRFLDEMLTRCMLRLDDVDTEGREDIRSARKAAVMQVQSCIEKLESKADESERRKANKTSEKKLESCEATEDSDNKNDEVKNDSDEQKPNNTTEKNEGDQKSHSSDEDEQTRL